MICLHEGEVLLDQRRCITALIRHPSSVVDKEDNWRSIFAQILPNSELRESDMKSLRQCQPQNMAKMMFISIEQLFLYTQRVHSLLDGGLDPGGLKRALTDLSKYHIPVLNSLRIIERSLTVIIDPQWDEGEDFLNRFLIRNSCMSASNETFTTMGEGKLDCTLGFILVKTLLNLLHCPEFCVATPLSGNKYKGDGIFDPVGRGLASVAERELLWPRLTSSNSKYHSNRIRVLRCALASLRPQPRGVSSLHRLWMEIDGVPLPHRATLFASLLNVICSFNPNDNVSSWIPFFSGSTTSENETTSLFTNSIHLFLLLLQHRSYDACGESIFWKCFALLGSGEPEDVRFVVHSVIQKLSLCKQKSVVFPGGNKAVGHEGELWLVFSHLLEGCEEARSLVCCFEDTYAVVETLLLHLRRAAFQSQDSTIPRTVVSTTLLILYKLSSEATFIGSGTKSWKDLEILKKIINDDSSSISIHQNNTRTNLTILDVILWSLSSLLLSATDWIRDRPLCYESIVKTFLNISPYVADPPLVVADRMASLLEIFSFQTYLNDVESTNYYYVSLLLEVYYFVICFNGKSNEGLIFSLLRRKGVLDSIFDTISEVPETKLCTGLPSSGNSYPTIGSVLPFQREYTTSSWRSSVLLQPVRCFIHNVHHSFSERFSGTTNPSTDDVLQWLKAYLTSPKGVSQLQLISNGVVFNPSKPNEVNTYSALDNYTWEAIAASGVSPACTEHDVCVFFFFSFFFFFFFFLLLLLSLVALTAL